MAGDRSIKVTLRADVSDFKNQFDQASKAADQVAKSTEDAGSKSKGVFGQLKQSAQDNRQAWTTAGTALTGFGAAILGVGAMAAKTGVAYNQLQQRAGSALEVLMGSAEAAAEQMAKLNEFADTSPFSREIFIEAQQQLIAFGVEAERVVPILSAVQDAVAATGGSNQDISELVDIIAKVGSTGKITAQTLNELGYRGVDAATIIGEQMGKTGQQIRDEITAGTLDADAAMQALTDGMSEKFGGAAAGMKETFDGALDRVRAAWRDLSAELMSPLVSPDGGGILVGLTNSLADAMRDFQALPGPVKVASAALTGLTGAASLGAGAFLLLLPRALDTIDAFKTLADINPRLAGGLGKVGKAAGAAAAAMVVLGAASKVADIFTDDVVAADVLEAKLANLAQTGGVTAEALDEIAAVTGSGGAQVKDFGFALDSVNMNGFLKGLDFVGSGFGIFDSDLSLATETLASFDAAMTGFAKSGAWDELHESFAAAVESASEYGYTAEDIIAASPGLQTALTDTATAMGLPADEATLVALALGDIPPAASGAADGMEGLEGASEDVADALEKTTQATNDALEGLLALGSAFLDSRDAARKYEDALKDANDAAEENGKHWEDGTKAARENAEAIDGLADAALTSADKMRENGEASGLWLQGQREDLIDVAMQMGATRDEAERYVDQLGLTPEKIETLVELEKEEAEASFRALWDEIDTHPPLVMDVDADTDPAEEKVGSWTGLLSDQPPTDVPVGADTDPAEQDVALFSGLVGDAPVDVIIDGDTFYAEEQLRKFQGAVNEAGGTVEINGDTMYADEAFATLISEINAGEGVVNINGIPTDAETALLQLVSHINGSEGVVTIEGNNDPAFHKTDDAKRKADDTTGTIDVDGNRSPADGKIDGVKSKADRTTGNVTVNASTGGAESAINRLIRPRRMTINVGYSDPGFKGSGGGSRFATGGPVYGPGTGTSDSIPALLSNGEHVITAKEVSLAGGHDAVSQIRAAIRGGQRFAVGGPVGESSMPVRSMLSQHQPTQTVMESAGGDMYNIYPQNDRVPELMSELQWAQKVNKSRRGRYSNAGR